MRVQADNINFNAKLRTASVLETTTGRIFENTGVVGMKAATEEITAMLEKEPNIDKETLRKKVQPYIAKLGTEIDIEV